MWQEPYIGPDFQKAWQRDPFILSNDSPRNERCSSKPMISGKEISDTGKPQFLRILEQLLSMKMANILSHLSIIAIYHLQRCSFISQELAMLNLLDLVKFRRELLVFLDPE